MTAGRHPQTQAIDTITVSRRIMDFLLRPELQVDPLIASYAVLHRDSVDAQDLIVTQDTRARVASAHQLLGDWRAGHSWPPRILLTGPSGAGKRTWAGVLAGRLGWWTLEIRVDNLPTDRLAEALFQLLREARLLGALPLLTGCDELLGEPDFADDGVDRFAARRETLRHALRRHGWPLSLTTQKSLRLVDLEGELGPSVVVIPLPVPDSDTRHALWDRFLPARFRAPDLDVPTLVAKYALPPGKAERIAEYAVAHSLEGDGPIRINHSMLEDAVRYHVNPRLRSLARHVASSAAWEDLILDDESLILLHTLVHHYRHRRLVHETWGIGRTSRNQGVCALFSGPPGTGKTLAANVVAHELGMELFQVDLASLVSKYIGETEKNLAIIFDEAQTAGSLILFDEADSLFGKRTQVKSSSDRYANMGTNYLLQRVEAFDGVVILTTNLLSAIDEAFLRRIQFNIAFDAPDATMRARLWRGLIPPALPLTGEVDYEKLAAEFEMSGGLIRNAVVQAAFFAAEFDCEVDWNLLCFSARLEMRSQGQLVRNVNIKEFFDEYRRRKEGVGGQDPH